ncbi:MAG: PLP-dependent aminotransferase family protein [Desulfocapsaceae bacterium]|jgi:2-aminoadipate transaminase|nr:PLP-dependent aminotransferase family protein [Desulfocapsaceae bacterium]
MKTLFSDRIHDVPRSFIREILKVSLNPEVISFAGGLPNRQFFPVAELQHAANRVFEEQGSTCLQYSNSEGLIELRQFIADRYQREQNITVSADNILITNGSQQALDLIAKIAVNEGDQVIIEEPGYLGAIQALSFYRPQYLPVPVTAAGMDCEQLARHCSTGSPRLMYTVPNFQNPSGITYPEQNRKNIAEIISSRPLLVVEDDPYGSLRFSGARVPSFHHFLPEQTLLLGSFSKVIVPGFRLGWVVAPEEIFDKLLIAKQAADLHTCNFTQYILCRFLADYDLDEHVKTICDAYGRQCRAMGEAIAASFPEDVRCTVPEGGMFLWGRLPGDLSAMELFERAVEKQVVFVPGDPFYTKPRRRQTFRLNFSCVDEPLAVKGIARLADAIKTMLR